MVSEKELEQYSTTYSAERLKSFVYSETDTIDDVIERYSNNIIISEALYPALCTLEVILRNAIDSVLRLHISQSWIEDEIKNNSFLDKSDYQLLFEIECSYTRTETIAREM